MIHPTAILHPGAKIAQGVEIGPYAVIGEHVSIGSGTKVGAHTVIDGWTEIGENNTIFHMASVGAVPQDLKYRGEQTYLRIGNGNTIREFASLHLGTVTGDGETTVGDGNLFMAYSHVAHDCRIGNNVVISPAGKPENLDYPNMEHPMYHIRDGIVIIPRGGIVPHDTII